MFMGWSGCSALTVVIVAMVAIAEGAIVQLLPSALGNRQVAFVAASAGLFAAAAADWFVGRRMNATPPRELVDRATRQRVMLTRSGRLFCIPMKHRSIPFAALALVPQLTLPDARGADASGERMRPRLHHIAAIFGLMLAGMTMPLTASAQTVRPIYREIGDWLLACDNVRDCVARQARGPQADAVEEYDPDAGIEVVRKAGPTGALTVRVTTGKRLDLATMRIPGPPTISVMPWRRSADGEDASLSGDPARRFVRAIADAPVLRLGDAHLSLKGLTAVLLAMDEAQGRIGNVTALMRPGSRPANATPAATLPPLVQVGTAVPPLAKPKELAAAVRRLNARTLAAHDCDMEPGVSDQAYPLSRSEAIVLLGCGRFAYQTSVLAFRTARDRPQQGQVLKLPEPRGAAGMATPGGPSTMDEYVDGSFDPATRVFAEYSKGRGMADCGSSTEWTFDGTAFRLSAFRWQDRCAGAWPGEWPTLYRTRRAPAR